MNECYHCAVVTTEALRSFVLATGMTVKLCSTCEGLDGPHGIALMDEESIVREITPPMPLADIEAAIAALAARFEISFGMIGDVAERLANNVMSRTMVTDHTPNDSEQHSYGVFLDESISRLAAVTAATPADALAKVHAWARSSDIRAYNHDISIDPNYREPQGFRAVTITIPPYRIGAAHA